MLRKKLVVVIGLVIASLVCVLGVFAVLNKPKSQQSAADVFLQGVLKGDAAGTYAMLSPTAQKTETTESWDAKVKKLSAVFSNASIGEPQAKTITSREDGKKTVGYEYTYSVKGSDGTYSVVVLISSEADTKILSLSSKRVSL